MSGRSTIEAVLFDVGDTLVHAAPPATATDHLQASVRPGVLDLLTSLSARYRLGAVTDTAVMTEADVRALLDPVGLSDLLEVLVTSVDVGAAKPDPRGILTAVERLGVPPERTLFVGDRDVDRDAAAAAGTKFLRVDGPSGASTTTESMVIWMTDNLGPFEAAAAAVGTLDRAALAAAEAHQLTLTKPPGSLGRLESIANHLASIAGVAPAPVPQVPAVAVFAGDHGVHAEGVTPWPQEVTAQMVANFLGGGAAICVLAREVGASVTVVDAGVANPIGPVAGLVSGNVRRGTRNLAVEAAMTDDELSAALDLGATVARTLLDDGADLLVTGDMGIANTTSSAALVAALCGRSPSEVTGRGTGVDDDTLARKVAVIERALARLPADASPRRIVAEVGGLEIAALAGFIVAGAASRVPVIVDGLISGAALLVAAALVPGVTDFCFGGHRSVEPGASALLDHLGVEPILDLDLRLGEGTGACLAVPVVRAAARLSAEMATFDAAGVTDKER